MNNQEVLTAFKVYCEGMRDLRIMVATDRVIHSLDNWKDRRALGIVHARRPSCVLRPLVADDLVRHVFQMLCWQRQVNSDNTANKKKRN